MARPSHPTITPLGAALRARRADRGQVDVAVEIGVSRSTLADIERGTHCPKYETAKALAAWLGEGWTIERVMESARQ